MASYKKSKVNCRLHTFGGFQHVELPLTYPKGYRKWTKGKGKKAFGGEKGGGKGEPLAFAWLTENFGHRPRGRTVITQYRRHRVEGRKRPTSTREKATQVFPGRWALPT